MAIWSGIDDLASSVTPATVYSNLQAYCTARHAVGWKVIVFTLPSNKFVDNTRDQFNTLLRANHAFADGFVDFASTPFNPDGSWANTGIYQSDGVHLLQNTINVYEVPTISPVVNAQ